MVSALPPGDVPYAAIDGETGFNGTLTEKIADAASKMEELDLNLLDHKIRDAPLFVKNMQKFYNFVKGGNDGLSNLRRETMFINILQGSSST